MLRITASCEVGDLIDAIVKNTGRPFSEVETAFFDCYLYPEGSKTYVTDEFGGYDTGIDWLDAALEAVLAECGHKSVYITNAI